MLREEVLEAIAFGQGVAESDRRLEDYFVKTRAFREIVRDDANLVLGAKGSGKTAISRVLASGKVDRGLEDIVTVAALSTESAGLFSQLPPEADEAHMRQIWMAYFASVASEQLAAMGNEEAIRRVRTAMELDGFPVTRLDSYDDRMGHLVTLMAPAVGRSKQVEYVVGSAGETANTSTASAVALANWTNPTYQFAPLIGRISEGYRAVGKRCWILFDRLDEAFPATIEGVALRGLLRAHMDLVELTDRISTKIFLRSDIYHKITDVSGFRNLDHLHAVRLSWLRESLIGLVAERIRASAGGVLGLRSTDTAEQVVSRCIPRTITYDAGPRYDTTDTFDWCLRVTAVGKNEFSPRNLIRLLREAQRIASARLEPDEEVRPNEALLRGNELIDAWHVLSSQRLVDTLYAEYPELRIFIESFYRKNFRMSGETLRVAFLERDPNCDAARIISQLEQIGLLYREGPELFDVAPLYRPSLQITPSATSSRDLTPGVPPQQLLSEDRRRDAAKELASQKQMPAAIRTLLDDPRLSMRNAILAINISIESRSAALIGEVETAVAALDFASEILGRRLVLKYALGQTEAARALTARLNEGDALQETALQFSTSLANDVHLEHDIWAFLIETRGWAAEDARPWDRLVPLYAAGRMLAVARGLRAAGEFDSVVKRVYDAWYREPQQVPRKLLQAFLHDVSADYSAASPPLRPYQVVSLLRVLALAGWRNAALQDAALTAVADRVSASAEQQQRDFRDWAGLDAIAAQVQSRLAHIPRP